MHKSEQLGSEKPGIWTQMELPQVPGDVSAPWGLVSCDTGGALEVFNASLGAWGSTGTEDAFKIFSKPYL